MHPAYEVFLGHCQFHQLLAVCSGHAGVSVPDDRDLGLRKLHRLLVDDISPNNQRLTLALDDVLCVACRVTGVNEGTNSRDQFGAKARVEGLEATGGDVGCGGFVRPFKERLPEGIGPFRVGRVEPVVGLRLANPKL